jgi:hypothetical protein
LVNDNIAMMHTRSGFRAGCERELWRVHIDWFLYSDQIAGCVVLLCLKLGFGGRVKSDIFEIHRAHSKPILPSKILTLL